MLISFCLLLFFILLQGLFAGLETGMISIRRPRIEHACERGSRSARMILFFINNPGVMISTCLLGVNISVVCASLAAKQFAEGAGLSSAGGLLAMTCVLSVSMLICEIIPKSWFRQAPCARCALFVWILYGTYSILYIPVRLFDAFTGFLSRKIAGKTDSDEAKSAVMREDLKLFLRESETVGGLPSEAASLLDNAIGFHTATIVDIMKKKDEVRQISAALTVREAMAQCLRDGISKYPVCEAAGGKWVGVFSSYHAIFTFREEEWGRRTVAECMLPVIGIPASTPIGEALKRTKGADAALFAVLDPDGEPCGIFTSYDIARKLFG